MCEPKVKRGISALPLASLAAGIAVTGGWVIIAPYLPDIFLAAIVLEGAATVGTAVTGLIAFRKIHGRWPFQRMRSSVVSGPVIRVALPMKARNALARDIAARRPLELTGPSAHQAAQDVIGTYRSTQTVLPEVMAAAAQLTEKR